MNLDHLQRKVSVWVRGAFGEASMNSPKERARRLLEEAVEFSQAVGLSEEQSSRMVSYVYNRPPGDPSQEIAGCLLTTLAAATSVGVLASEEIAKELDDLLTIKGTERVRLRNRRKVSAGVSYVGNADGDA